ncbi:CDP-glycerol:glycerophosphate glycerophosphotransferase [Isoptericola sp. 4D.3]|uniref:CDP-glycerol:glycerophosphate glycerophosphotransferase n=1 Tax=Isoptericola peretonis TaxID=2918523 RepID=A0ABT0J6B3_9MICO|nr:CDP-glycerol:glycerophosphate glycerophosphotransferase [Isoptericola sp. 4D.3]
MSVVVPVYNVERYVGECLESILAQTHRRLEVVVVDDGSPDDSISVVQRIAARDRRVRVVRQENAGLGAARNTGVRHARGSMLCFVDSDDTVPPNAVEAMLTSLTRSGSDFAVGSLLRDTSAGKHMPPWARKLHDRTRTGVTIADEPDVLKNVFAWTKLFRTDYFRRVVGRFPDGLYEDQVPSAKAYLHGRFDVLQDVVCHWRIRDDESSITQQKSTMRDLTGRWTMLDELHEVMRDAPEPVRRAWEAKVVGFDMRPYYEQVPRTDDEYWSFLQREVRGFVDMAGYERLAEVPVADRLLAAATYHGLRDDVVELVARRESLTWKVHGIVDDGGVRLGPDYLEGLSLRPDGVLDDLDGDVEVLARTADVVLEDGSLLIEGSAFLSFVDLAGTESEITVDAVSDVGTRVVAHVERFADEKIDMRAADPWNDHSRSGFRARLDLGQLVSPLYRFEVGVLVDGVERRALLTVPDPRGAGRLPKFGTLDATGRWYADHARESDVLELRCMTSARVPVEDVRVAGRRVELVVAGSMPSVRGCVARSGTTVVPGTAQHDGHHEVVAFDLPQPEGDERPRTWTFAARPVGGGRERRFSWVAPSRTLDPAPLADVLAGATRSGNVVVQTAPLLGEVEELSLGRDGLRVRGWAAATDALRREPLTLALVHDATPGSDVPLVLEADGRFDVVVPVVDALGSTLSKTVNFVVTLRAGDVVARPRASAALVRALPLDMADGVLCATASTTPKAGSVSLRLRTHLDDTERSRRSQHRLQQRYHRGEQASLEAVLLESFGGRSVGDSPLALSRELHRRGDGRPQYWSVACLSTPVPEWATPVLRFSAEWYDVLERATLLINNNNWPWYFRKGEHQTYLQTWHGTPLKRIGNDVPGGNLTITYRRLMQREAQSWDYLLSQNEYSAEIFPAAFGFDGKVLVEGYPRNDALVDDTAERTRAAVRRRLGLDDDVRVLLYAPTWRDNVKEGARYGRVAFLDFDQLARAAGPRTVVLYRGHSNTAASSSDLPGGVVDVTHHPDVNELMLASDALVTDYSSIMFDYGVLRRPIFLLVPDLELYGTTTRGFYRNLEDVAPGPLCADTSELVAALGTDHWSEWGAAHDRFVAEFAPRDDGAASARVVDAAGLTL